jgi:hypothetical protein
MCRQNDEAADDEEQKDSGKSCLEDVPEWGDHISGENEGGSMKKHHQQNGNRPVNLDGVQGI